MFAQQFDTFIATHRETFLEDLCNFIRIPSISLVDKSDGMREAVLFLQEHMQAAGCTTCVYDTEGNPIIFAEIGPEDAAFTLLIYGHYDVFPADDRQQWITDPFEPVILDDRIYGRGAGDNKGQILAHLQALKVVQQVCGALPIKVKFLIEGEEETGSTHLPAFVREHQDELRADLCCYSYVPRRSTYPRVRCTRCGLYGVCGPWCPAGSPFGQLWGRRSEPGPGSLPSLLHDGFS